MRFRQVWQDEGHSVAALHAANGEGFRTPAPYETVVRNAGPAFESPLKEETAGRRGSGRARTYGDLRVADGAPASVLERQGGDRVDRKDDDELVWSRRREAQAALDAWRGSAEACEDIAVLVWRTAGSEGDRRRGRSGR
jgi:hypothetical protein